MLKRKNPPKKPPKKRKRLTNFAHHRYLGDCGPDVLENSTRLRALWTAVAPLVAARQLRVIMIEASFDDAYPDALLFGRM